jgi:hypothetical protein
LDEVVAGKLKQIDKISSMLTLKQIEY